MKGGTNMDNRIARVIGENIRKRIDEKGLLMREVAAEVNVLEHTFFGWMRGERQPSAYALYRLARYFGCTMEDLMEGVEENG